MTYSVDPSLFSQPPLSSPGGFLVARVGVIHRLNNMDFNSPRPMQPWTPLNAQSVSPETNTGPGYGTIPRVISSYLVAG